MVARGVVVDNKTHVGIGKVGKPNNDIFKKSWLAEQEGCGPEDRCWLPLIANSGCVMCPDPASHGGEDSSMHSYQQDLQDTVRAKTQANAKARAPSARVKKEKEKKRGKF